MCNHKGSLSMRTIDHRFPFIKALTVNGISSDEVPASLDGDEKARASHLKRKASLAQQE
jgi:hypothetical protein